MQWFVLAEGFSDILSHLVTCQQDSIRADWSYITIWLGRLQNEQPQWSLSYFWCMGQGEDNKQ